MDAGWDVVVDPVGTSGDITVNQDHNLERWSLVDLGRYPDAGSAVVEEAVDVEERMDKIEKCPKLREKVNNQ